MAKTVPVSAPLPSDMKGAKLAPQTSKGYSSAKPKESADVSVDLTPYNNIGPADPKDGINVKTPPRAVHPLDARQKKKAQVSDSAEVEVIEEGGEDDEEEEEVDEVRIPKQIIKSVITGEGQGTLRERIDKIKGMRRQENEFFAGGHSSTSLDFGSMPTASRHAMQIVRQWQGVPDSVGDMEAIEAGFITPEMLMLIMTIMTEVMSNCFSNKPTQAWNRVQTYASGKWMDRMADNTRLMWVVSRWMGNTGFAREPGDVTDLAGALTKYTTGMSQHEFTQVQREILFMAG